MQTSIQARGFPLTEVLRSYVERRLLFALSRFSDRIGRVAVILEEVSISREGVAYTSQIRIEAARLPPLIVEETAVYLSLAIDRAADRARRALARKMAGERGLARFGRGDALPPEILEIFT